MSTDSLITYTYFILGSNKPTAYCISFEIPEKYKMLKNRNGWSQSHVNFRCQNYRFNSYSDSGHRFTGYFEHEKFT